MFSFFALLILGFVFTYFYLFFHVLVHELGHFFAAKLLGFKNPTMRIGSSKNLYQNDWLKINVLPISGGVSLEREPKDEPGKYIILSLAGVAGTWAVAIPLNILWWYFQPANLFLSYGSLIFFVLLYADIVNFIPIRDKSSMSDGGVFIYSVKRYLKLRKVK